MNTVVMQTLGKIQIPLVCEVHPQFWGGSVTGFISEALGSFQSQEVLSLCTAYAQSSLFLSF